MSGTRARSLLGEIEKALTRLQPASEDGADGDKPVVEGNALGLLDMVKAAVERYRTTVTWIVTSYAAVLVVLIGTAPFAGLGDLSGLELFVAAVGLLVAGLGAITGIYAASRVLEPEDASLGELSLGKAKTKPGKSRLFARVRWFLRDEVEAVNEQAMWGLFAEESKAYFGTSTSTPNDAVRELIKAIDMASDKLRDARVELAQADDASRPEKERAVAAAKVCYDDSVARRERTLAVAVSHQVRGKYLSSRRTLLVGGTLVLLGTLGYLSQVAANADDEPTAATASAPEALAPVEVRLQPDTGTGLEVTAGGRGCLGGRMATDQKLIGPGFVRGQASAKGPWDVAMLPPAGAAEACRPVTFSLKDPDGRIAAR